MRRAAVYLGIAAALALAPVTAAAQAMSGSLGSLSPAEPTPTPPPITTTPEPPITTAPPTTTVPPVPRRTSVWSNVGLYGSENRINTEIRGWAYFRENGQNATADAVQVQVRTVPDGEWKDMPVDNVTYSGFTVFGLDRYVDYDVRVRHEKSGTWTEWTDERRLGALTRFPAEITPLNVHQGNKQFNGDNRYTWSYDPTVQCGSPACAENWKGRLELQLSSPHVGFSEDPIVWDGPTYSIPFVLDVEKGEGLYLLRPGDRTPTGLYTSVRVRPIDIWGNAGPWTHAYGLPRVPNLNPDFKLVS